MWIRLHATSYDRAEERPVMVQTKNITHINRSFGNDTKDLTVIGFIGDEQNYLYVKESIDEIGALITEEW